jgi:signal transduction histidine kinase
VAVRLADYYAGHIRRVKLVTAAMLFAVNITLTILLIQFGYPFLIVLVYVLLPVVLLQIFSIIIILRFALEPLEIMTRAVTHVSPQDNDVTPPQINEPRHEKSGLKSMVQTIYDNGANPAVKAEAAATDVADILPCGIIAMNEAGVIVYANERAPVVTNAQGITNHKLQFVDSDNLSNWLETATSQKMQDERVWQGIADASPDQQDRKVYDVICFYQKNAPSGFETILVTVDRTRTYVEDEESIDFISVAAHELRGPITVIRGYLDVLVHELGPVLKADQKELVERLDVSASRLSGYVNNILNVAKYDRRHLDLHLIEDRFSDIYAVIADDLQLRARTQRRILSVSIPTDLPTIAADRNSLSEVLANLVDNAIKYSKEGGTVEVIAKADGDFVTCSVKDKGIGIPTSVIGNLFSKFYRSHRSRTTVSGTGLGLYISKAIIESHGGQISASSKEGHGSTFAFSVPIYSTVAEKLTAGNNGNQGIVRTSSGWIKNHGKIGG